jgi:hypothetical protein
MRGQRYDSAALYPRERPGIHFKEAGWALGPVRTGTENLAPTGIRSPARPARRQSLYRLSYPAPLSNSKVKERVQLHRYSPYDSSWPVLGRPLPLLLLYLRQ